jgi:transcriptional regulator with XRE-family HTH domain
LTIKEIVRIRKAIPMGLREFAAGIGVHYITLWHWEIGKSKPHAKTMRKIQPSVLKLAKKYNVPMAPVKGNGVTAPAAPAAPTKSKAKAKTPAATEQA